MRTISDTPGGNYDVYDECENCLREIEGSYDPPEADADSKAMDHCRKLSAALKNVLGDINKSYKAFTGRNNG